MKETIFNLIGVIRSTRNAARATASQFVRKRVDLIVAFEDRTVRAATAATSQIPIVVVHVYDPPRRRGDRMKLMDFEFWHEAAIPRVAPTLPQSNEERPCRRHCGAPDPHA
jgi:hypothetical protein